MYSSKAFRGARRLVEVCGALEKDEEVAIVTDTEKISIASLIAGQVVAMGAEATVLLMDPREIDGDEPTSIIANAMELADLIILAATYSLAHTEATRCALEGGSRVLSVSDISESLLASGGLYADFDRFRPFCEKLADIFTNGDVLFVKAPGGTEIELDISGRSGNAHHCIADQPGMFTAVPNIEANVAPVEGFGDGIIVFDASIPNFNIGVLEEPVRLDIQDGCVIGIDGGRQAKYLAHHFGEQREKDDKVCNVAQVAVGLNPMCGYVTGQLTNDHGVLGTMHFGIGTSKNLGGELQTTMHIDGILWRPTILIDDQMILENGELVGDWAKDFPNHKHNQP